MWTFASVAPQELHRRLGERLAGTGGCTSVGELAMTFKMSAVAVWRSSAASAASRAMRISASAFLRRGDVAVDQHRATAGHRVVAYLEHAPVGPRALGRPLTGSTVAIARHFLVGISVAEFATLHQQAHILLEPRAAGEEGIRHVEQLLEVPVPRGKPQVGIEHHHTVAHVVEGNARSSAWRSRSSSKRRAFSMAITAWSAKPWRARSPSR
jgi:hypothetical protein